MTTREKHEKLIRQLFDAESFARDRFGAMVETAGCYDAATFTASMASWRNAHNVAARIALELADSKNRRGS